MGLRERQKKEKTSLNLCERIKTMVENYPDNQAVWANGAALSYSEIHEKSLKIAEQLNQLGVSQGDRVAVLANRSLALYASILGILYSGAGYVALNPRFPISRNEKIIQSSEPVAMICDLENGHNRNNKDTYKDVGPPKIILQQDGSIKDTEKIKKGFQKTAFKLPFIESSGETLAYLMFTSGSTGEPKGVPITHKNVCNYLDNLVDFSGIVAPGSRVVNITDITFDLSVHDMFYAWTHGGSVVSVPENATLFADRFIVEHEITHWFSVPSTARLLVENAGKSNLNFPSLEKSFFCGEPLVGSVAKSWANAVKGAPVFNLYGPTEATVAVSGVAYAENLCADHEIMSLGKPFGKNRLGLFDLDTSQQIATDEEIGEICISGPQISKGYWKNKDLNNEKFFNDHDDIVWYRTGDLGKVGSSGEFIFAGRVDQQVKLRGFRVELGEIEGAIRDITGSAKVAVLPWPVSEIGDALGCVAFVVMHGTTIDEKTILDKCRSKLPHYMVPSSIHELNEMPLNANGKTDYQALKVKLLEG